MASPADSLWLQKSITITDPLPNDNGVSPPRAANTVAETPAVGPTPTEPATAVAVAVPPVVENAVPVSPSQPSAQVTQAVTPASTPAAESAATPRAQTRTGEMDLTKMVLDTSLFASAQRPSSFRYSLRASVANAGGVSAMEYDELRSRYSQAKRELLKVGDVQKDLDFARFELTRCKEELKMTQASYDRLRADLDEANERVEVERRARADAEQRAASDSLLHAKEVDFLKGQVEELRQQNSQRIHEMSEEQEQEYRRRLEAMRDELSTLLSDSERLQQALSDVQGERDAAVRQHQDAVDQLETARADLGESKHRIETIRAEMEQESRRLAEKLEKGNESFEAQLSTQRRIYEERLADLMESKTKLKQDSEEETRALKEKLRELRDEMSTVRQRCADLEHDAQQVSADREKEVNRLIEEHRMALSEKELQMEAAVREARSSKVTIDEENYSLRRKAAQLSEELSTVSAVLAQRDREREAQQQKLSELQEAMTQKEVEHARIMADLEMHAGGLEEANERLARLQQERDELEDGYSHDLRSAKDRIRDLEQKVMTAETELSQLRREAMRTHDSGLSTVKDLRHENDELRAERDQLRLDVADKQHLEEMLHDVQSKLKEALHHNSNLQVELKAVAGRSTTLEQRLDEALRRHISQSRLSPANNNSNHGHEQLTTKAHQQALRSVSCTNRLSPTPGGSGSLKRARTEDARVVAISGFDGKELLAALNQLPSVAIAECQSNVPVPSNLTHLITNGHATVKLLTALVRGCWVLPSRYVMDSLSQHAWLPESEYGFQHEQPPLQKKHVAMTEGFKALKFHSNADLLLREGGAIFVSDPDEADMVLCTSRELDEVPRGVSWEGFVDMIYPVKISQESA